MRPCTPSPTTAPTSTARRPIRAPSRPASWPISWCSTAIPWPSIRARSATFSVLATIKEGDTLYERDESSGSRSVEETDRNRKGGREPPFLSAIRPVGPSGFALAEQAAASAARDPADSLPGRPVSSPTPAPGNRRRSRRRSQVRGVGVVLHQPLESLRERREIAPLGGRRHKHGGHRALAALGAIALFQAEDAYARSPDAQTAPGEHERAILHDRQRPDEPFEALEATCR